jgi:hypothetical protein
VSDSEALKFRCTDKTKTPTNERHPPVLNLFDVEGGVGFGPAVPPPPASASKLKLPILLFPVVLVVGGLEEYRASTRSLAFGRTRDHAHGSARDRAGETSGVAVQARK